MYSSDLCCLREDAHKSNRSSTSLAHCSNSVSVTPSSRAFEVHCSATDNCDPDPEVSATMIATYHEVVDGDCVEHIVLIDPLSNREMEVPTF